VKIICMIDQHGFSLVVGLIRIKNGMRNFIGHEFMLPIPLSMGALRYSIRKQGWWKSLMTGFTVKY